MTEEFIREIMRAAGDSCVLRDEPMAKHTTFRIGGPADLFVRPETAEQVAAVLQICRSAEVPCFILWNGSNLLVSDAGYRGLILQMDRNFQDCRRDGYRITVQAGMLLTKLASLAKEWSLAGLAFASGIPGTVGGAVAMNAGAYGGEIRDVLKKVRILTEDLREQELCTEDLDLGYRRSRIMDRGWIVLEAEFCLEPGNEDAIRDEMERLREERQKKQPLEYASAGSTFKRPEGFFAGKLIMDTGLAGFSVGPDEHRHCHGHPGPGKRPFPRLDLPEPYVYYR